MPDPRISVLMPVFNAGRFLEPAIRSIVGQTFQNWELLIVDDGSSDGSRDVAAGWARRDGRIRVIANRVNQGQTVRLNQGLHAARGEWIARQDADDLSHPLRLARQFERVTSQPELVLLGCCGRIIDADDSLTGLLDVPLTPEEISWTAPFLNPFLHTGVLFRTGVVRETLGGYDEHFRIAQDYDLWTRIAALHPVANLGERLVCYRHLESSLSKSGRSTAFQEAARISSREAARVFGRTLTDRESRLMASFREGLAPRHWKAFWEFYERERAGRGGDLRRIAARHRLRSAGAMAAKKSLFVVGDLLASSRLDPVGTFAWVKERLAG